MLHSYETDMAARDANHTNTSGSSSDVRTNSSKITKWEPLEQSQNVPWHGKHKQSTSSVG